MRVYFVRHGQTDANINYDKYPWDTNCPINETGKQQVRHAAAFLQGELQSAQPLIISSPLLRAQQTAAILAEALAAPMATDERLFELRVGSWHDRVIATVYAHFMSLPPTERYVFKPPNGESWVECGARVAQAVQAQDAIDIIVVSHSAPIQSGIGTLLQTTYNEWATNDIKNASVSLLTTAAEQQWQAAYIGRIFDPTSQFGLS